MIVDVTAEKFRGLKNPYTGEPIVVKMLVPEHGSPMFFAPDTYSTAKPTPSVPELVHAWDRVDGVGGMKDRTKLTCAYTGETLRIVETSAGFFFEGGFNPGRLMSDEEFLKFATMRDGKPGHVPSGTTGRVEFVEDMKPIVPTVSDGVERTEEALKVAEGVVNRFKDSVGMQKTTVVSMAKTPKKGKR